jgi:hypothetical protein
MTTPSKERTMEQIRVVLNNGRELNTTIEERVYPDRTYGQYDSGWFVAYGEGEDDGLFVTVDGRVYEIGTANQVGTAPALRESFDRMDEENPSREAEVERHKPGSQVAKCPTCGTHVVRNQDGTLPPCPKNT